MLIAGVKSTSMNIHLLSHLPACVQQWGPFMGLFMLPFREHEWLLKAIISWHKGYD